MQLENVVKRKAIPIVFGPAARGFREVRHGTFCVIEDRGRLFLLTAAHVIQKYAETFDRPPIHERLISRVESGDRNAIADLLNEMTWSFQSTDVIPFSNC